MYRCFGGSGIGGNDIGGVAGVAVLGLRDMMCSVSNLLAPSTCCLEFGTHSGYSIVGCENQRRQC